MNILMLAPYVPFPLNNGGRIRVWYLSRELAREHNVSILAVGSPSERAHLKALRQYCRGSVFAPSVSRSRLGRWFRHAGATPEIVSQVSSAEALRAMEDLCRTGHFDLVYAHQTHTGGLASVARRRGLPVVIDFQNVESAVWRQLVRSAQSRRSSWRYRAEAWKLARYEASLLEWADLAVAVSDQDSRSLRAMAAGTKVVTVPNGVDTRAIQPVLDVQSEADHPRVVFAGTLGYPPNIDAVGWLAEAVWPVLRRERPDLEVVVAGAQPPPQVIACCRRAGIALVPDPADMVSLVQSCRISVVPLRIGGGSRLKILESMAAGVPVVSTTVGSAGLDVSDGEHLLVRDDAAGFAHAILDLLADNEQRRCISRRARALVEKRYDWEMLGDRLRAALMPLVGS